MVLCTSMMYAKLC